MTKRVQLAGGSAELEQVLVGLERELRVDLDNDSLRLHDGVKVGGYEFLNRDANDGRYQRRSLELDGFKFGAQEKGFLVRVSPSNYKLRKLTSVDGSLTIVNPRGTAGDLDVYLSSVIPTDNEWTGIQTFTQPIAAEGGLVGNVTGDLTGDSFGTHTGDVIGNLTGDTFGTHTGNVDVRGANFIADDGQILETQIDPLAWIRRGVPYGAILMWAGLVADIPDSWALCDGDNGTPDLRDRFVIGAGNTYAEGAVGGTASHTHTGTLANGGEHTHNVTVADHVLTVAEIPAHKHGNGIGQDDAQALLYGTQAASSGQNMTTNTDNALMEGFTETIGGGAAHTHAGSVTETGGTHDHDITLDAATLLPPYYALCYIMKIV